MKGWFKWTLGIAGVALGYYLLHLLVLRWPPLEGFMLGVLAGAALTIGLGLQWAVRWVTGKFNTWGKPLNPFYNMAASPLRMLSLAQVGYLLKIRLTSVMALLDTIFLRRIRSQGYAVAATTQNVVRVSSVLDRLVRALKDPNDVLDGWDKLPAPRKREWIQKLREVQPIVEQARVMGTTLWWLDDAHRLDSIIASAELTLCFRLLWLFEQTPPPAGSQAARMQQQAWEIWESHAKRATGSKV